MAENKAEIKIEDKADYTENVAPEYKNYSSVARKPFEGGAAKSKSSATSSSAKQAESPQTPKAPTK